jgi:hypothetical protein
MEGVANCLLQFNTGDLLVASKEIGLEVKAEKTKYTVKSRDRQADNITASTQEIQPSVCR